MPRNPGLIGAWVDSELDEQQLHQAFFVSSPSPAPLTGGRWQVVSEQTQACWVHVCLY